ncbi:pseudaminic acid biosynthesis-associated methylase [Desulfobacula sp.]|uniref:pseudaminic acid biosynthesis-associated methylase n=1 Tax=Desulfobacula sp. TaxID=2593537 RepID=UPI00260C972A|nr:pseudaminic acid biosynthesis-associated methylase [Desulfobacula sp.]
MQKFNTAQEDFWAGEFGNNYIERNKSIKYLAANIAMFSKIINKTENISSVIEFGANVGMNLKAIKMLLPEMIAEGIEINKNAFNELSKNSYITAINSSIFDYKIENQFDLALIKTVLIHINPDFLPKAYDILYQSSKKYILIAEYYNPTPVEVTYRGHKGKLFKRDFAGEMMEKYHDLSLIDYGFIYKRDKNYPQDDINWFLLEKKALPGNDNANI